MVETLTRTKKKVKVILNVVTLISNGFTDQFLPKYVNHVTIKNKKNLNLKITPVFKLSHLLENNILKIDDVIYDPEIQINFLSFFNRFSFLILRSIIKPHVPLFFFTTSY